MTVALAASPEGWEVADDDVKIKFKDQFFFKSSGLYQTAISLLAQMYSLSQF